MLCASSSIKYFTINSISSSYFLSASSIRFGTGITKDMYDFLSNAGTSVSFGVIAKGTTALGGAELTYDNASIKKTITPARVASIGAAVEDLEGDYYQFALVLDGITEATYNKSITARVFVCVDGEYYYRFDVQEETTQTPKYNIY